MKKNPIIYLDKKQENNEKKQTQKCLKKVKTKLEKHATGTCTYKLR